MIPRTFPSVLVNNTRAMYVNVLTSVDPARRWIDWIPVKVTSDPGSNLNSYNGSAYVQDFPNPQNGQAWLDYIPVYVTNDPDAKAWTSDNDGFIPVFGTNGGNVVFAVDMTATSLRNSMLANDVNSSGWLLGGSAGARLNLSARTSVATQLRGDDLLGATRVVNGALSSGLTGWSQIGGVSVSGQTLTFSATNDRIDQTSFGRANRTHRLTLTASGSGAASTARVITTDTFAFIARAVVTVSSGVATYTVDFTMPANGQVIVQLISENGAGTLVLSSVALQEVIVPALGYEFAPHNLLANSATTVWTGNFLSGQSNVSSTAVPALVSGTVVQLATRGSGGDNNVGSTGIVATAGQQVTLSCYVWLPSSQTYTQVRMEHDSTLTNLSFVDANLSIRDQWQRISVTGTVTGTNVTQALRPTATAGTFLYHTAWQINLGNTPSAYIPTGASPVYGPAIDWIPSLSDYGIRSEEASSNRLSNSMMIGAVSGSPGTLPTSWQDGGGLTRTVTTGVTLNGFPAIDVRYQGTLVGEQFLTPEAYTAVAGAASGQAWSASSFAAIVAGSLTNVTPTWRIGEFNSSLAGVADSGSAMPLTATGTRYTHTRTLNNATTTIVRPWWSFVCNGAVDFTVRLALPQLEQKAFVTSPIPTWGTVQTRQADVLAFSNVSWLDVTKGTFVCEAFRNAASVVNFPVLVRINGNAGDRVNLGYLTAAGTGWEVLVNNVNQAAMYPPTTADRRVITGAYAANDFATNVNGGSVLTDTSGTLPAMTAVFLGSVGDGQAINQLNGYITRLRYTAQRLANSLLQSYSLGPYLDFSLPDNSQYGSLISVGGL